jgi:hypothetical protein
MKLNIKTKLPFGLRLAKVGMEKSTQKIRVGSSLLSKGQIVIAWNQVKTSVAALRHNYKWPDQSHAEFNLFSYTTIPGQIHGTVYVYRELANGELAIAKPCKACRDFLQWIGIKKIVYTDYGTYRIEKL